jgi:hypothetical protein
MAVTAHNEDTAFCVSALFGDGRDGDRLPGTSVFLLRRS